MVGLGSPGAYSTSQALPSLWPRSHLSSGATERGWPEGAETHNPAAMNWAAQKLGCGMNSDRGQGIQGHPAKQDLWRSQKFKA